MEPFSGLLLAYHIPHYETANVLELLLLFGAELEDLIILQFGDGRGAFLSELLSDNFQLLADPEPTLAEILYAILGCDILLILKKVRLSFSLL